MSSQSFPSFAQFLGGWLHQDFDLDGDKTLEAVVARYKRVTDEAEVSAAKQEVDSFLKQSGANVERAFVEEFSPDVDPGGWGLTTREWLERIRDLL